MKLFEEYTEKEMMKAIIYAFQKYPNKVRSGKITSIISNKFGKLDKKDLNLFAKSINTLKSYGKIQKDSMGSYVLVESDPCWKGYKQYGMKKKNGKEVPNCVPEAIQKIKDGVIEEAEYQGRDVKLNKPMRGDSKKYKVYVKNDKGNVVKVEFGDKKMQIQRDNPEAKKSFRARHKCDQKKDKTKAGYWSCKMWSSKKVSDILKGK